MKKLPAASTILDASVHDAFSGAPTFTLSNRLVRLLWSVVWLVLARWTPPFFRRWRVLLLKLFGADVHWSANVYASVTIWYPGNLSMGPLSAMGPRVNCYSMGLVRIGERSIVSQGAHLCGGTHAINDRNFQLYAKPIVIGSNVWIAAEAFVGPGVCVADGAVLGARGVAFSDLEAWQVYVGNPAKAIKAREAFDHE